MYNDEITFDKLPQAITYLIEQVAELKQIVLKLQPNAIREACIDRDRRCITNHQKSQVYHLYPCTQRASPLLQERKETLLLRR